MPNEDSWPSTKLEATAEIYTDEIARVDFARKKYVHLSTFFHTQARSDDAEFQVIPATNHLGYFTYKMTPNTISITDTRLGRQTVTEDIEAVLRKIEYWHQGSVAEFKIMYRYEHGVWDGIRWDGRTASFFAIRETDEGNAVGKLLKDER